MSRKSMSFVFILIQFTLFFSVASLFAQGAVYTMSNAVSGNEILVFSRAADGTLTPAGSFPTGGLGTGSGLGNQGGVVLSRNGKFLFVVNAGSDEISVFSVKPNGLTLRDKISSGGRRPISITVNGDIVYVLNAGGSVGDSDNITGFIIEGKGNFEPIVGSTRPLSAASTGPAQIEFSRDGSVLVVTEKDTNIISTYTVDDDGIAAGPNVKPSVGATPFGFAFGKRDQLFVSEAFGGAPDASAVSSYEVSDGGNLQVISASVGTMETAACWVVITKNGRFAYVTNTGSSTISGYQINQDGSIALLDSDGVTATTGAGPIDMDFSRNSHFLYSLNSGANSISLFRVSDDGSLISLGPDLAGLPAGANGLAAQ
ncbi:lactonase family protein [bacterium]|nr:lactonase family protein [bacterium]MCI0612452.1 lactonase family protein [bacterium]